MRDSKTIVETGFIGGYQELQEKSPVFKDTQEKGSGILYLFPFLFHDLFSVLYEEAPKFLPPAVTSAGSRLNRLVLEQLMKSSDYGRVRHFTRQNRLSAGMAAVYYGSRICQGLDRGVVEIANEIYITEEELADALLEVQAAGKIVQLAYIAGSFATAELYQRSLACWNEEISRKKKKLQGLLARLSVQWNTAGKRCIGDNGDGRDIDKFAADTGGLGSKGVWTTRDLTPHLKAAETYLTSPKLKQLALRVGRLKQVKELKFGLAGPADNMEVRGIEYGNDLNLVIPEEWVEYFKPNKRAVFHKRFADESLCLYEVQGRSGRGAGSLIICLDTSGSMQGSKEGTAKAVAIALMEIAMAQQRNFVLIMFGGPRDEMKIFDIPLGQCTFAQFREISEFFLRSAGTDFEKPLNEALKYIEKDKYPDGDIVFITDGVCQVSAEFRKKYENQKKSKHFRTIGVLVNYGQVSQEPMRAFCDEILWSKDLKGIDIAGELFGKIRSGHNLRGRGRCR
ncbi:MAG: VWA domain-containing protein [Thermincola sp.]|jgi:uncharacterized protein with von Willebrand factor type A (vWA) domain|nr:VWA domain-containing protein [Thermincola sp.]MDT3704146.1 VWA domain-containing protein [Thermincola sp.]